VHDLDWKRPAVDLEPERLIPGRKAEHQDGATLAQMEMMVFRPVPLASPTLDADVEWGGSGHSGHRLRLVQT